MAPTGSWQEDRGLHIYVWKYNDVVKYKNAYVNDSTARFVHPPDQSELQLLHWQQKDRRTIDEFTSQLHTLPAFLATIRAHDDSL
jgi:hypothetical protein